MAPAGGTWWQTLQGATQASSAGGGPHARLQVSDMHLRVRMLPCGDAAKALGGWGLGGECAREGRGVIYIRVSIQAHMTGCQEAGLLYCRPPRCLLGVSAALVGAATGAYSPIALIGLGSACARTTSLTFDDVALLVLQLAVQSLHSSTVLSSPRTQQPSSPHQQQQHRQP